MLRDALKEAPMAEYEFECRQCKKIFTVFMRITERLKAQVHCPGCGSDDVEALMQAFCARTGKKS
jgi:putative FmdB family regulatory protein